LLPGTARPGMRRMEKVTGRTDDMIILRGVNLFPTQIEEIVLRTPGLSPHFALELTTRSRMDHLIARVEARPDCPTERRAEAAAEVAQGVKDTVGSSIEVLVVDPETLPRSVGKLQRLVDHRERA
jgi:phenylacetate-CoA ligase